MTVFPRPFTFFLLPGASIVRLIFDRKNRRRLACNQDPAVRFHPFTRPKFA